MAPGTLRTLRQLSTCGSVALFIACGNEEWRFDDAAPLADAAVAPPDAAADAAPCGECGEGERCKDAVCECLPSRTRCGTTCVALVTDPQHCGTCDVVCTSTQACRGGTCQ